MLTLFIPWPYLIYIHFSFNADICLLLFSADKTKLLQASSDLQAVSFVEQRDVLIICFCLIEVVTLGAGFEIVWVRDSLV